MKVRGDDTPSGAKIRGVSTPRFPLCEAYTSSSKHTFAVYIHNAKLLSRYIFSLLRQTMSRSPKQIPHVIFNAPKSKNSSTQLQ